MFESGATELEFECHWTRIEEELVEGFADFFMDRFGPIVTARQMLGERFGELRSEILTI